MTEVAQSLVDILVIPVKFAPTSDSEMICSNFIFWWVRGWRSQVASIVSWSLGLLGSKLSNFLPAAMQFRGVALEANQTLVAWKAIYKVAALVFSVWSRVRSVTKIHATRIGGMYLTQNKPSTKALKHVIHNLWSASHLAGLPIQIDELTTSERPGRCCTIIE